jgi:hypothetical protein
VAGEHAFSLTVDRSRLQAIFKEAGRPDLLLPESVDGAGVTVTDGKSSLRRLPRCTERHGEHCNAPAELVGVQQLRASKPGPES